MSTLGYHFPEFATSAHRRIDASAGRAGGRSIRSAKLSITHKVRLKGGPEGRLHWPERANTPVWAPTAPSSACSASGSIRAGTPCVSAHLLAICQSIADRREHAVQRVP